MKSNNIFTDPARWPDDGIYKDIPAADYHALDAIGSGGVRTIHVNSLAHFKAELSATRKTTAAMDRGTVMHSMLLEPDEYAFRELPAANRGSLDGLTTLATFYAGEVGIDVSDKIMDIMAGKNKSAPLKALVDDLERQFRDSGLTAVPGDVIEGGRQMTANLFSNQLAADILSEGYGEVSLVWTLRHGGKGKARLDWWNPEWPCVLDLKTCQSADYWSCYRKIRNENLAIQEAHYLSGIEQILSLEDRYRTDFIFAFAEAAPPYDSRLVMLGEKTMNKARNDAAEAAYQYSMAKETGDWPGYSGEIEIIEV